MVWVLQPCLPRIVALQDRLVESNGSAPLQLVVMAAQEFYDGHSGTDLGLGKRYLVSGWL